MLYAAVISLELVYAGILLMLIYNKEHGITPKTIVKRVDEVIRGKETKEMASRYMSRRKKFSKKDKEALVEDLRKQMKEAAAVLDFERAAELRDMIAEIQTSDN